MRWTFVGWTSLLGAGAIALAACGGAAAPTPAVTEAPKTAQSPAAKITTSAATAVTASPQAQPAKQASPVSSGKATGEPINYGIICDRSGPTAYVTATLCDGLIDWLDYTNNGTGGIKGRPIELSEVDAKYEVPLAVDAYKRMTTRENIPMMIPFGTPLIDALSTSSAEDKVVMWSPGFGVSEAADGSRYPFIFVGVATYHSQALAIMQYIADDWKAKGNPGNPKVTYIYFDNPAGRDPLELIQTQGPKMGLDIIDAVAVPATTVDMTTIMTQVKEKNPDYTMDHLFGRTPPLALQAAHKVGFPRERMIGFVWALSEDDIRIAGEASEGALGIQFAAHPNDNPEALRLLEQYWQSTGKPGNPKARETLHYARGVMMGNFFTHAAETAEDPTSSESLKQGIETWRNFTAHDLLAGTTLTPEDHGGTRQVRMYQVKDGKMQQVRDWFEGPKP